MGINRIIKNLKLNTNDVVEYCKNKVLDKNCNIYVYFDNKMYSEFLNIYKGPEVLHVDNMSIKQVMGR